jgi:hypothetical protein
MPADPIQVLKELAAAAEDVAATLAYFPVPGSAPSSAIARVLKRIAAALEAHKRAAPEIQRRLLGRSR